jgi:transcriptional regulator with XRE-family HTH domain
MRNVNFGVLLRRWRTVRRLSQLHLALDADISTRHLSCVETGRAQPSREMVVRLAEALQVPLRERNALLLAAGYAPLYRDTSLDTPELEAARRAVEFLMAHHEPYPVLVVDRYWNTLRMNAGAKRFLALFPGCSSGTPHNGPRLVFHPQGLRPFIENWESVAASASRSCGQPLGRHDEMFPGGVAQLPGRPQPLAYARFRWRSSTVLDHQLQVEELDPSPVFRAYHLRHSAGYCSAGTAHREFLPRRRSDARCAGWPDDGSKTSEHSVPRFSMTSEVMDTALPSLNTDADSIPFCPRSRRLCFGRTDGSARLLELLET